MSSLENRKISETYKDLLQISNSNTGVDGTMRYIQDGEGTSTGLGLSTASVQLSSNTEIKLKGPISTEGHIIPTTNSTYDIGSAEYKVRHLFLSDNSIYMGTSNNIAELK